MKRLSMAMTALAVMGLMTMVSCRKPNVNNVVPGAARTVTFNAATESGNGSKTTLDGLDVNWSAGDQISVNGNDNKLTLEGDGGSTFGRFTGTITATAPYLVGYPATATNDGTNITFTISDNQDGDADFDSKLPMAAYTADENGDLSFRNMANVLKLDLTGSQDITKIEVESAAENLSGTFTVGTGLTPNRITSGTKKITITKEMTLSSTAQTVYVVLPVFGSSESTVTIKFTGTEGVKTVGPKALTGSTTPNHRYSAPVAVSLVVPKPDPSSVSTTAGCNSELIYTMGGTVTLPSGAAQQVEYGFVCSQSVSTPEVGAANCFKFVGGIADMPVGTTSFTVDITGLTPGVSYYVRAYAIGESGTAVHAPNSSAGIKTITGGDGPQALPSTWTNGTNPHPFTVASGVTVNFSQGNLQYIGSAATPYWKFADHQFDLIGSGQNSSTDNDPSKDRDLFGWGTSGVTGYTPIANCVAPWSTSTSFGDYYAYGSYGNNLYDGGANAGKADWGYNSINVGDASTSGWRTLKTEEWKFLFNERPNAANKYGHGKVGSCTPGMIILPDDWAWTGDVASFQSSWVSGNSDWSNVYSYTDWSKMESAGAVFLPAAGYRPGTSVSRVGSGGDYWSGSYNGSLSAYFLDFYSGSVYPQGGIGRYYGFSVRLVR